VARKAYREAPGSIDEGREEAFDSSCDADFSGLIVYETLGRRLHAAR